MLSLNIPPAANHPPSRPEPPSVGQMPPQDSSGAYKFEESDSEYFRTGIDNIIRTGKRPPYPLSGFFIFGEEIKQELRAQGKPARTAAVTSRIQREWRKCLCKDRYHVLAREQYQDYKRLVEYWNNQPTSQRSTFSPHLFCGSLGTFQQSSVLQKRPSPPPRTMALDGEVDLKIGQKRRRQTEPSAEDSLPLQGERQFGSAGQIRAFGQNSPCSDEDGSPSGSVQGQLYASFPQGHASQKIIKDASEPPERYKKQRRGPDSEVDADTEGDALGLLDMQLLRQFILLPSRKASQPATRGDLWLFNVADEASCVVSSANPRTPLRAADNKLMNNLNSPDDEQRWQVVGRGFQITKADKGRILITLPSPFL